MALPVYKLLKLLILAWIGRTLGWLQLWQAQCTLPRQPLPGGDGVLHRDQGRMSWLQMWQQEVHVPRSLPYRHDVTNINLNHRGSDVSKLQLAVLRMRTFSYPPCGNALEQWSRCYARAGEPDAGESSDKSLSISGYISLSALACCLFCYLFAFSWLTARYCAAPARLTLFVQLPVVPVYREPLL